MMNAENYKDTWFEDALRADLNCDAIDFDAVEACLLDRINRAEEMGVLSLLKLENLVSMEMFQIVEKQLFAQISQYKEYEEPVNECIKTEDNLTNAQWERLEAKLFSKIQSCSEIPLWEQFIMASQSEPLAGDWERIEGRIFEKISHAEKQESWILCTKNEEVCIPVEIENEEKLLEEILDENRSMKSFEQELKREIVLTLSQIETVEDSLFSRIEKHNQQIKLEKQPFWAFIDHYLMVFKTAGLVSSALILLLVGGLALYPRLYNKPESPVNTFAYQVHGSALNIPGITGKIGKECASISGGMVKLINRHGSIELRNDSKIEMLKITEKRAHYRVSLHGSDNKDIRFSPQVAFLVNRHQPDEEFLVHTSDYQIAVKGTYFKLEPGFAGTVTTRVLEGVISVSSRHFDQVELHAGQSLRYDPTAERYVIEDGGQVMLRHYIEEVPQIDSMAEYQVLQIRSSVEDAKVFVNGKLCGTAPVAVRSQVGSCSIRLISEGYVQLDTVVIIGHDDQSNVFTFTLNKVEKPFIAKKVQPQKLVEKFEASKEEDLSSQTDPAAITPELISSKLLEPDNSSIKENEELYSKAQKEELAGNWDAAIDLYQKVFDNHNSARLIREDALFSIGRLKADYLRNSTEASQVFLTYLALFPQGSFAGESWLRLAELEFSSRPENAIRYYEKFFQLFPQHPRIMELKNRVGVIYLQKKQYDEAIALFKEALNSPVFIGKKERALISENLERALQQKAASGKDLVNH